MRAFLINPEIKSVEEIQVSSLDDVKSIIGFDSIESDAIGTQGDRLYFDEECFLRGTAGRYQIDNVIPVSGKGVIVGTAQDGTTLLDAVTSLDELSQRINYL